MRIPFAVSAEPPPDLLIAFADAQIHDATFRDRFQQALSDYFTSSSQPQTFMLPRNLVKRTVIDAIAHFQQTATKFPKFEVDTHPKKFVRCCYRKVWRTLLDEWKARLLLAAGKTPAIPSTFDPWLDIVL